MSKREKLKDLKKEIVDLEKKTNLPKLLTIYPDVDIKTAWVKRPNPDDKNTDFHVKFETCIRKQHEGIWYLIKCLKRFIMPDEKGLIEVFMHFNKEVYMNLLFAQINPKAVDPIYKTPIFEKDPDQRRESDRLQLMHLKSQSEEQKSKK